MLMGFLIMFMVDFKISSIFFPFLRKKLMLLVLALRKFMLLLMKV